MTNFKLIAAALLMSGGLPISVQSSPISQSGIEAALQDVSVVDQVQYRWAGHEFCFYDDGWRGPGWYWCGYRLRSGFGWGGPTGWHGWRTEGVIRERGRIGFEERGRVGSERRGSIEERGRIGVEERGRVGVEGRGSVGVEGHGRIERGTFGRAGIEGSAGSSPTCAESAPQCN
jgi:hypothetical protein